MPNIIDLAVERTQRQILTQQATDGTDAFVAGLHRAGQTLANLAWVLAAPVRHHDTELKDGIYTLVLARLNRIITGTVDEMDSAPEIKAQAVEHTRTLAFAAFQTQLLTLAAAELDGVPAV